MWAIVNTKEVPKKQLFFPLQFMDYQNTHVLNTYYVHLLFICIWVNSTDKNNN